MKCGVRGAYAMFRQKKGTLTLRKLAPHFVCNKMSACQRLFARFVLKMNVDAPKLKFIKKEM